MNELAGEDIDISFDWSRIWLKRRVGIASLSRRVVGRLQAMVALVIALGRVGSFENYPVSVFLTGAIRIINLPTARNSSREGN
jgi:hypothetical protein